MRRGFLTVPEELLAVAERLLEFFEEAGYSVSVEDSSRVDYPYMPTLRCRRMSTTLLVEVVGEVPEAERLREWKAYCSSQSKDTRFALGAPLGPQMTAARLADLGADGIGLFAVSDEYAVQELLNPHDLPLNLQPPSLKGYPNRVRTALGPAWQELRRGNWQEGFDSACVALEIEVRRYLDRHIKSGRLSFQTPAGKAKKFAKHELGKLPMGRLVEVFGMIVRPNHADSMLLRKCQGISA